MNFFRMLKATAASAAMLAFSQAASAGADWSVNNGGGTTLGQMSKNVGKSLVDGATMFEAGLYLFGIIFVCLFIFTLVKWKKSEGREGNPGLIAIYLVAAVFCMAAPTLMSSGAVTIFGSGTVKSVSPPSFGN